MSVRRHRIVVEGDETTNFSAYSPDVPGVVATGATREECERELQAAIEFHLEGLAEDQAAGAQGSREPLLALEHVSRFYKRAHQEIRALDDVSLEVQTGTFVGVIGERKSGKSTLLRVMAGIEWPSSGRVFFEGRDIAALSNAKRERLMRRRVALFEPPMAAVSRNEEALEHVALPALSFGISMREGKRRAMAMLARLDLTHLAAELTGSLSYSDRAHLAFARVLVRETDLLLLDEPTSGLDPLSTSHFLASLAGIARERHMTVVLASGDVTDVAPADRVVALSDSRLSEMPRSPETQAGHIAEVKRLRR
jgi:ABC-type lipoprotein export system ATPase subunit/predicted RNase H-like HicB family nuclease